MSLSFLTPTPYQIRNHNRRRAAVVGRRGQRGLIDRYCAMRQRSCGTLPLSCIKSLKTTKKKHVTLCFGTFMPVTNLLYLLQYVVEPPPCSCKKKNWNWSWNWTQSAQERLYKTGVWDSAGCRFKENRKGRENLLPDRLGSHL